MRGDLGVDTTADLKRGHYVAANVVNLDEFVDANCREVEENGEAFASLMDSIKACPEVVELIHVRVEGSRTILIAGYRRRAAVSRLRRRLGLAIRIPACVEIAGDDEKQRDCGYAAAMMNLQSRELRPVERACAFKFLADAGTSRSKIGQLRGFDCKTIDCSLNILLMCKKAMRFMEAHQEDLAVASMYRIATEYRVAICRGKNQLVHR